MGKDKRKRKIWSGLLFAIGLLLLTIIYGFSQRKTWSFVNSPPVPIGISPQSAEPLAPPTINQELNAPMPDRRQVAFIIIEALNKYYADHQEYPPFLLGGFDEDYRWQKPFPDPLLAKGYLTSYPLFFPDTQDCMCGNGAWPLDSRSQEKWVCMFSTPGDHLKFGVGTRGFSDPHRDAPDLELRIAEPGAGDRQYALGGRNTGFSMNLRSNSYSMWPGKHINLGVLYRYGTGEVYNHLPFFGYQRGEWLGKDSKETWLWFYGSNLVGANSHFEAKDEDDNWVAWGRPNAGVSVDDLADLWKITTRFSYQPPQGIDLVNAVTGEPVPDGIPDGICLQYILRDGELVESIAAPGLN